MNPQALDATEAHAEGDSKLRARRSVASGACCRAFRAALVGCALLALVCAFLTTQALAQSPTAPLLRLPSALAYDAAGNLYIADAGRNQVLEASLAGALTVVAGTGTEGFTGDGGPASAAELDRPQGLAFGSDGTLYIADTGNARIRSVQGGIITTFAGKGARAYGGDGGSATLASLREPAALAVDSSGALLVCDVADQRVRRISAGTITSFAGDGVQGFAGDGGSATSAELDSPSGIAVASDRGVLIADTHNHRIRLVASDGTIRTYAGTGSLGYSGDGGPAIAAQLSSPRGVWVTAGGSVWIGDTENQRVRSVNAAGIITTLAGASLEGASVDGSSAASAPLRSPRGLALSSFGMPAFTDTLNATVWVLTPTGLLYRPAALAPGRTTALQTIWPATVMYGAGSAAVQVGGLGGSAAGVVSISEGAAVLGSATLTSSMAALDLSALNAGKHDLTVTYAGDGLNPAAVTSLTSVSVTPDPVIATASAASMPYGGALPAITGTLTGVLPRDAGLVSAVFTADPAALAGAGSYPILASLTGPMSGNYILATGATTGVLQVTQAGSSTVLGDVGQAFVGLPLRLSASVLPATSGKPGGAVQFLDGATVVATASLVNGSAYATYTPSTAGSLSLSARYSGSTNYAGSMSSPQMAIVGEIPDFNMAVSGASTATVAPGLAANYTLQISAQPAPFTGVVTLSASGLPAGATVNFSPVQVVPGTGSPTVVVSITPTVTQASLRMNRNPARVASVALAGLLACVALVRLRKYRGLWLLSAALFLCGCGARTVGELGDGAQSQSYNLQITGTSTNLAGAVVTHSAALTLIVQN